jgi:hypothetical protein
MDPRPIRGFSGDSLRDMTDVAPTEESLPPVAHATIVYLGPTSPHWEIRGHFGDERMIDDFRVRVNARLLLLPKHDPQFRRNRERVNRDAERELIRLDWDLGDEPPPAAPRTPRTPRAEEVAVAEAPPEEAPDVAEEAVAEEAPDVAEEVVAEESAAE